MAAGSTPSAATEEFRRGWPVMLISMAGYAISLFYIYPLSVAIKPIQMEMGWTRAQITSGLLMNSVLAVVCAPFMGMLIDRIGIRRVGIPGIILFSAAIAALSTTGASLVHWWLLWLFVSCSILCIKPTLWVFAICQRFERKRGLALAVVLCGGGIGSGLWPALMDWLVGQFGWRGAYRALGALALVTMLPVMLLYFRDARAGAQRGAPVDEALPKMGSGPSRRRIFLSSRFLRLGASALIATSVVTALNVHFVSIATDAGMARSTAALLMIASGATSLASRLATGMLLDRMRGSIIGAVAFALPVFVALLLLHAPGNWYVMLIATALLGAALGAEIDVVAYMVARYFGLASYGTIFGTISGLITLGGGIGPTVASYVYGITGGYSAFLWGLLPVMATASLMMATLGPYPRSDAAAEA